MTPQEEQKFRKVKIAVDKRKLRLRDELRRRFKTPEALFRQLGMDGMLNASRSVMDDKHAQEFAQHGHGRDDADMTWDSWEERARAMMGANGMSEDDMNELFSMLPERQHIKGEKVERTTEDDEGTQGRLESRGNMEKSATNSNRRDDMRARETEHRDSEQSEDAMPHRSRGYLPGNKFAHDADAFLRDLGADRIGTSMSAVRPERSVGPNNFALDSVEQNAAFLKKLDRLSAR